MDLNQTCEDLDLIRTCKGLDLNRTCEDLDLNGTCEDLDYSWVGLCPVKGGGVALGVALLCVCALGLVGNGLVLLASCGGRQRASVWQVLLLHLALADLLLVLVLPWLVAGDLWGVAGAAGAAGCKLLRGGYAVSVYGAALLLAAVSADRYSAVVLSRRRLRPQAPGLSRAVCAAVWVCAAALSLPNFLYYDLYTPQHSQALLDLDLDPDQQPVVCELRFPDSSSARLWKVLVPVLQLVLGFLLPLVLMWFCYGRVAVTLLRGRRGGRGRGRAVRLVLAAALVFAVCHLPYNVVLLLRTLTLFQPQSCRDGELLEQALTATQALAYLHCALNPLLYGFTSATFRMLLQQTLHTVCCKLHPQRRPSATSQSEPSTAMTL